MQTKGKTPDVAQIRKLARVGLPSHFKLKSVRCLDGAGSPFRQADFELVIEYENCFDEDMRGGDEDIEAFKKWEDAFRKKIRSDWPPEKVAIIYLERGQR